MKITDEMVEAAWGTLCKHVDPEGWPTDAEVRFALKAALAAAPACPHIRSSGPPKRATNWCALAAAPQWVSCAERLPEAGVEVLVRVDGKRGAAWSNSYMLVAFVSAYGDTWLQDRHPAAPPLVGVTHWMPLPAAPRSER